MIEIRRGHERGASQHGWLDSKHSFSFADYWNPARVHFRALRVLNDDRVAPGAGFPTHGHRDMDIISYVLEGKLAHKDSMGNGSVIEPGDVQRMSAGSGVRHSEFNASDEDPVHFLQIWIVPERTGMEPSYEQQRFNLEGQSGVWQVLCSYRGDKGGLTLHQDVTLLGTVLAPGQHAEYGLAEGRHAYVHVARGRVRIGDIELAEGDAFTATEEDLQVAGIEKAELLLFDLA